MAHIAELDENNAVLRVIVVEDSPTMEADWQALTGKVWKKTSYNTYGGVHSQGGTPFRKNYAGVGYTYDAGRDAFIPPQPPGDYSLNETTCLWEINL